MVQSMCRSIARQFGEETTLDLTIENMTHLQYYTVSCVGKPPS